MIVLIRSVHAIDAQHMEVGMKIQRFRKVSLKDDLEPRKAHMFCGPYDIFRMKKPNGVHLSVEIWNRMVEGFSKLAKLFRASALYEHARNEKVSNSQA